MPKIPRDLTGIKLAAMLGKFGYTATRQSGSHIRLTSFSMGFEHHLTIPNHSPLKIGTLNGILKDVADYLRIHKNSLITKLFEDRGD
jgi:predicted RNA binding protein YcfA (HicA-like mRNA interferase family)